MPSHNIPEIFNSVVARRAVSHEQTDRRANPTHYPQEPGHHTHIHISQCQSRVSFLYKVLNKQFEGVAFVKTLNFD